MQNIIIKRPETDEEIRGMGQVFYESWHETYENFFDRSYLSKLTPELSEKIAEGQKENSLIAVVNGQVVGFIAFGRNRDEELSEAGEVYALYVLPKFQGKSVGYRLMKEAIKQFDKGVDIFLWVLKGNEKAISFYLKFGFCFDGKQKDVLTGMENSEWRMIYNNQSKHST